MEKPVLRFDRADGGFVIIQVARNGTRPLDVKFIGTDSAYPYVLALRQNKINDLRIPNAPCTDEEWVEVLEKLVRQEPQRDIEATAAVVSGKTLTITIRKRVGGITQRLGSLVLSEQNDEIELFDWCGASVEALLKSKKDLGAANDRVTQLQTTVRDLETQLDELIAAKNIDEAAWLEKFRDLLNEKKEKIREQQKIIDEAPIVEEKKEEEGQERQEEQEEEAEPAPKKRGRAAKAKEPKAKAPAKPAPRKAGASRPGKRKTHAKSLSPKDETDDDEPVPDAPDADKMAVDGSETEGSYVFPDERMTTDDDATASEADDVEVVPPARPVPTTRERPAQSTKQAPVEDAEPPPRRTLPVAMGKASTNAPLSESDTDDEL